MTTTATDNDRRHAAMALDIIARSEWGARRRKSAPDTVTPAERRAVMLHYSTGEELGREDTAEWVRQIQAHHMDANGWADIGYNFLVDVAGRIFEGRGWDAVGAHCLDFNRPAVGVCFLGDDDPGQDITDAARRSIAGIALEAERRAGHNLEQLGHRDRFATACPGDEGYQWWTGTEVAAPAPRPTPAPTTGRRPTTVPTAPRFPLPAGRYFGPGSVTSSHYLGQWQRQLNRRWLNGRPYGHRLVVDGRYGPITAAVARAFQDEKGLDVDGLIGPETWAAAFTAPITR